MNIIEQLGQTPWDKPPPGGFPLPPKLPRPPSVKLIMVVIVAGAVAGTAFGGFYTVQPTELAGIRRFGTVVTAEPVLVWTAPGGINVPE